MRSSRLFKKNHFRATPCLTACSQAHEGGGHLSRSVQVAQVTLPQHGLLMVQSLTPVETRHFHWDYFKQAMGKHMLVFDVSTPKD
jgi:hypothetical protein